MSDINCPYCDAEQDICHDDGYGYSEDRLHDQTCSACDKTFMFSTYISFSYAAQKADCKNGGQHAWEKTSTFPRRYTKWKCKDCDDEKNLTGSELAELLAIESQP